MEFKYILYIALPILFAMLVFLFAFGYILFIRICKRRPSRHTCFENTFSKNKKEQISKERIVKNYAWLDENKDEDIQITSFDGLKLFASVARADAGIVPNGVVLVFHGYRSSGKRDFCMHLKKLHDAGYHLLVVDQRAHGRSEGKYLSYGLRERYDVLEWRKKATEIFGGDLPICFMGLSMGGATVLMASGLVSKDDGQIRCVVADCPFSSPWDIVRHVLWRDHKIYPYPVLFFINFWCRIVAGINLRKTSAAKSVSGSKLPYLILHGGKDTFVPLRCSEEIVAATNGRAKLVTFPDAKHSESIYFEEERYTKEMLDFLSTHMK